MHKQTIIDLLKSRGLKDMSPMNIGTIATEIYRNYVSKAEDPEERKRRINRFRCDGW